MMSTTEETGRAQHGTAAPEGPGEPVREAAATAQAKAQEKVAELTQKGTGVLRGKIDERTGDASRQSRALADALRRSSEEARQQGNAAAASASGMAAQRLEQVAGYLERTDGDTILRDAEQLARRQPWAVAGVGMMAGLAAARVIKVSIAQRQEGQPEWQPQRRYGDEGYGQAAGFAEPRP